MDLGMGLIALVIILGLLLTLLPDRAGPSEDRAGERELKWNRDFHDRNGNQV